MAVVNNLLSGDLVYMEGSPISAVFIARTPHPLHKGLQLVVWRLSTGEWSFDALRQDQEIGNIQSSTGEDRGRRLITELEDI